MVTSHPVEVIDKVNAADEPVPLVHESGIIDSSKVLGDDQTT